MKDIEYTYWKTIESSDEWETIDLIGPKRQDLVEAAGEAPGSWSPPGDAGSREVVVNPPFYPEGLPDEQFEGRDGYEVLSYMFEPQERPGPIEQPEVLSPPFTPVSDAEAYRALYELASFVGGVAAGVAVVAAVVGSGGTVGVALLASFGAGAAADVALVLEGFETDRWEELGPDFAKTTLGLVFGQFGAEAYYAGRLGEALGLWLLGLLPSLLPGDQPAGSTGRIGPHVPEP